MATALDAAYKRRNIHAVVGRPRIQPICFPAHGKSAGTGEGSGNKQHRLRSTVDAARQKRLGDPNPNPMSQPVDLTSSIGVPDMCRDWRAP